MEPRRRPCSMSGQNGDEKRSNSSEKRGNNRGRSRNNRSSRSGSNRRPKRYGGTSKALLQERHAESIATMDLSANKRFDRDEAPLGFPEGLKLLFYANFFCDLLVGIAIDKLQKINPFNHTLNVYGIISV